MIRLVELPSERLCELGVAGSPTIFVNDRDLFPADETFPTDASSCRLYATPQGLKSHPTAGMVREALEGLGVRAY